MAVSCVVQIIIGLLVYKPMFLSDYMKKNTGAVEEEENQEETSDVNNE